MPVLNPLRQFRGLSEVDPFIKTDVSLSVEVDASASVIELRTLDPSAAYSLWPLMSANVCQGLAVSPIKTMNDCLRFLFDGSDGIVERVGIWHTSFGWIGTCGYSEETIADDKPPFSVHEVARISYWIAEPYQNQGFGKHAVKQFVHFLQEEGFSQFIAQVYAYNVSSQRLLASIGFVGGRKAGVEYSEKSILDFKYSLPPNS